MIRCGDLPREYTIVENIRRNILTSNRKRHVNTNYEQQRAVRVTQISPVCLDLGPVFTLMKALTMIDIDVHKSVWCAQLLNKYASCTLPGNEPQVPSKTTAVHCRLTFFISAGF